MWAMFMLALLTPFYPFLALGMVIGEGLSVGLAYLAELFGLVSF